MPEVPTPAGLNLITGSVNLAASGSWNPPSTGLLVVARDSTDVLVEYSFDGATWYSVTPIGGTGNVLVVPVHDPSLVRVRNTNTTTARSFSYALISK